MSRAALTIGCGSRRTIEESSSQVVAQVRTPCVGDVIEIVHDYSTLPGVAQALTDFLSQREKLLSELPTTQAMIVV